MKGLIKDLLPPAVLRAYRRVAATGIRFSGDYESWDDARAASTGYDAEEILRRARDAALKVKRGEARFERDSIILAEPEYSFPMLATLLRVAARRDGELTVLDFGGALGSSYRQFKAFGAPVRTLRWHVVEQPQFVQCGRESFEDGELAFFSTIAEAVEAGAPDVVLLSSVLQYLEKPYERLTEVGALGRAHLIIDRTPCSDQARDVLTVQSVPRSIYDASYPCWILSRQKLTQALELTHAMVASFQESSGPWHADRMAFSLEGFILEPKG